LNKNGFSLIEVLIGLIILAIGVLGIAGMQITSVKGNFFSDNIMQASILCQDRLEGLKSLPISNLEFTLGEHDDGTIGVRGTSFSRRYVVATVPSISADSRMITVTVGWRDNSDHSISFSTIKCF